MELILLVIALALFEYMVFTGMVGMARGKYNVKAPAIQGHPVFERYFRVQQNTLEQLIIFIPAILTFSYSAENLGWRGYEIAAALGVVWLIGRAVYARAYVKDPLARAAGFLMTFFPNVIMVVGTLVCVLVSVL